MTTQIIGTKPELAIYKALSKMGVPFEFQSQLLGAGRQKGSSVIDFYIPSLNIAIYVQGLYWHYSEIANKGREQMQRLALESRGIKIIYIDEDHALRNPTYYVKEALAGRDHSRMAR